MGTAEQRLAALSDDTVRQILRGEPPAQPFPVPRDYPDDVSYLMALVSDVGGPARARLGLIALSELRPAPAGQRAVEPNAWHLLRLVTLLATCPVEDQEAVVTVLSPVVASGEWKGRPPGNKDLHRELLFCLAAHAPPSAAGDDLLRRVRTDMADARYAIAAHAVLFTVDPADAARRVPAVIATLRGGGIASDLFTLGAIDQFGADESLWNHFTTALTRPGDANTAARKEVVKYLVRQGKKVLADGLVASADPGDQAERTQQPTAQAKGRANGQGPTTAAGVHNPSAKMRPGGVPHRKGCGTPGSGTFMARAGDVEQKWYVVDATDLVVGRLAVQIANVLRGKHKPEYTPHCDTGDFVVVVNAEKVQFTGKKWEQKSYQDYSHYAGGQKITPAKQMLARKPEEILRRAVERMMPSGPQAYKQLTKLRIYAGSQHPHQAQRPVELAVPDAKVSSRRSGRGGGVVQKPVSGTRQGRSRSRVLTRA